MDIRHVNYRALGGVMLTLIWNCINCHGYTMGSMNKTWTASKDTCAGLGSILYMQTQIGHWGKLNTEVNLPANSEFWIGLWRAADGSPFKWADGSSLTTDYWNVGQPSSASGMNCVKAKTLDGKWEATQCSETNAYVCQNAAPVIEMMTQASRPQKKYDQPAVMMEGLLRGFGMAGGLILLIVVIINLPCCRNWVNKKDMVIAVWERRNVNIQETQRNSATNQAFDKGY